MSQRVFWSGPKQLVLWDGNCRFCERAVTWFRRRDKHCALEFVPYQDATSPPMTPELRANCARALHLVTSRGEVLRGGAATLFMLEKVGWNGLARALRFPPFIWFVELGYMLIASNRSLFSRLLPARE
jgi:predicted DCC family thiol-disulfide oxidoreductase YuxK